MRIGALADRLGTPHAIRFYERSGHLPVPTRGANRYREYTDKDVSRLRLLIGLRQLDLPLAQAADLATLCASGRCDEVSDELKVVLADARCVATSTHGLAACRRLRLGRVVSRDEP
jgi:DNA-binding transcriptional MerR regulator